ncbi:STAS/SEC14 domain-containing protein [Flammeovirgaceae bacterium SG7u.111]|nr:STAS/SEC14 domain-containing protein [Flammeovirgaceae bacterium SG7u.132]WPO37106.1 STAS/SEC14 domain-containing protein [Flammeovirgaceae bacterium SG7u.111]
MEHVLKYSKKVLKDTEAADIIFIPEMKLLQIIWKGKVNSEQYKETFLSALKYADIIDKGNFMSDIRRQVIIGPRDRTWFEEVALPSAIERGLQKAAVVFDGNIFKEYYLNHILVRSKKFDLPLKFFRSTEEAIEWLNEK